MNDTEFYELRGLHLINPCSTGLCRYCKEEKRRDNKSEPTNIDFDFSMNLIKESLKKALSLQKSELIQKIEEWVKENRVPIDTAKSYGLGVTDEDLLSFLKQL